MNNPSLPARPADASVAVDIWTEQDRFGMFSYDFVLNGTVYTDHDYQSRANALEAARSEVRSLLATQPEGAGHAR